MWLTTKNLKIRIQKKTKIDKLELMKTWALGSEQRRMPFNIPE